MNITDLLSITISIAGVLVALAIYLKQQKDARTKYLAHQIKMFYEEEQLLVTYREGYKLSYQNSRKS